MKCPQCQFENPSETHFCGKLRNWTWKQSLKKAFPKAKEAAEKALEIDDSLAEAHSALGFIKTLYEWGLINK